MGEGGLIPICNRFSGGKYLKVTKRAKRVEHKKRCNCKFGANIN